ncbi:MAG: GNAT family N-acetyltransferase [Clostridia bacterium]|nr:GNAT family N-acetyltransferase [Clostridia bacterium]
MVVETKRLKIHTATREEMTAIIEEQSDDVLKTAYREMLQGCMEHPDQWEWFAIWVIESKDGIHIGDLCFKGLGPAGSAEIGYGISEEFRDKGFATEAVDAAVNWALAQPDVKSVEAETEPDNRASQRVLEKCGFVPTGAIGEEGPRFIKTN